MRDATPNTIYLKDYAPPAFLIPTVALEVEILDDCTRVRSRLSVARNPKAADQRAPLALDGNELELESVAIDGRVLGWARGRLAKR